MWQWLSRILLAVGFLAVVWVVADPKVQGQGPENVKLWLPQVAQTAAYTLNPLLSDYVGLVAIRDVNPTKSTYFTVRGDGSDWTELAEDVFAERVAWSPDGAYFLSMRGTDGEDGVWLTRLSDRYSWQLTDTYAFYPFWSPDSRHLVFYTRNYLYRYDIATDTLTAFAVMNESYGSSSILWSPDSRTFAWWVQLEQDWPHPALAQLYLVTDGQEPLVVFTGFVAPNLIVWAPDSQKVLFNVWNDESADWSVYESSRNGTSVRQITGGLELVGFVDHGTRLLLRSENALFLANADGSEPTLFANDGYAPSIAPTGDKVLYWTPESLILKSTGGDVIPLGQYYLENPMWRSDGNLFTLRMSNPVGTALMSANFNDPGLKQEFESDFNPHFLPLSKSYLAINVGHYDFSPGYPVLVFEGTHLYDTPLETLTPMVYPESDDVPVIEWRYMP